MIPKRAKRVFKGKIFDVYHWRQKMFDGSLQTFERITRQNTVVILASKQRKVVILKQKQPGTKWFLTEPAGRMDKPGESPKQAAERELLEETGLKAQKIFLWKKVPGPNEKVIHYIYVFIAQGCQKVSAQSLDPGEKIQVLYKSFDDWLKLSDRDDYYAGTTIIDMLRARLHPKFRQKLKKLIFG